MVDLICLREGFAENAQELFALGYMGKVNLLLSSLSLVNAMYICRKYSYQDIVKSLTEITSFVDVIDMKGQSAVAALSSSWSDYEDAVQFYTALSCSSDCIVTRNEKDFALSTIPVYNIEHFLNLVM